QTIKAAGKKPGVVLNPATHVDEIDHVMGIIDQVLIMTVNPGFGGQAFLPLHDKISAVHDKIKASGRDIRLAIDGGITPDNSAGVIEAGANVLIAGTAIFGKDKSEYAKIISQLRG
ncbi:MAG TPA: ribulose-phosphate 3-epimerase, partial [Rhodospirillaceae bacterium]|nr:ribulose-phosphate 3-epimerase [Rhodospirillaceae bacterium]